MKLRITHPLISAYAALATIAIGLLMYGGSKLELREPATEHLVIESIAKLDAERIASQITTPEL